jgi:hypothetical protein
MNKPHARGATVVDCPAFNWYDDRMRDSQVARFLRD